MRNLNNQFHSHFNEIKQISEEQNNPKICIGLIIAMWKKDKIPLVIFDNEYVVWQYRLWSFQGRDTKLEKFLAKNQLQSNEITKFGELE